MTRGRHTPALTLVELLVVIAIIAILIALLIGPIMRARRGALVLACPIATQGPKHRAVMLHPRGSAELELTGFPVSDAGAFSGPAWSTNGTWIAHTIDAPPSTQVCTVIVHAMSGRVRIHRGASNNASIFLGWADNDHFIENGSSGLLIREADAGRVTNIFQNPASPAYMEGVITRVPPSTGAHYIAAFPRAKHNLGDRSIALLRKDFSIKKVIHVSPGNNTNPRVDPFGEYAAWSTPSHGGLMVVAVKALNAPTSAPAEIIKAPDSGYPLAFADWTEDGNILAFEVTASYSKLVILTRTGKLVRTLRQGDGMWGNTAGASYRIYRHQ